MNDSISWRGLTIDSNVNPEFSSNHKVKIWDIAIRTDDLELLKILIQKEIIPSEKQFRPLPHVAFINKSNKIMNWLLSSSEFQEEVRTVDFLRIMINHYDPDVFESWFKMVRKVAPYLLGSNPFLDEDGNIFITKFLCMDEFLFTDESFKEWLLSEDIYGALEIVNKKGFNFLNYARKHFLENRPIFSQELIKSIDEIEEKCVKKKLERLPKSLSGYPSVKHI